MKQKCFSKDCIRKRWVFNRSKVIRNDFYANFNMSEAFVAAKLIFMY